MAEVKLEPVALEKSYRLLNVGGTTLVSAYSKGREDLMPATWACALDLSPALATVVLSAHYTRDLIEESGMFALQLPTLQIADETMFLGSVSKHDLPDKVEKSGIRLFKMPGFDIPLAEGCAAWMIYKMRDEPEVRNRYDLFIGECVAAWSDPRVFSDGHWHFEKADPSLSTIHYVAGSHFYTIEIGRASCRERV